MTISKKIKPEKRSWKKFVGKKSNFWIWNKFYLKQKVQLGSKFRDKIHFQIRKNSNFKFLMFCFFFNSRKIFRFFFTKNLDKFWFLKFPIFFSKSSICFLRNFVQIYINICKFSKHFLFKYVFAKSPFLCPIFGAIF